MKRRKDSWRFQKHIDNQRGRDKQNINGLTVKERERERETMDTH